jgi:hypothetical protein
MLFQQLLLYFANHLVLELLVSLTFMYVGVTQRLHSTVTRSVETDVTSYKWEFPISKPLSVAKMNADSFCNITLNSLWATNYAVTFY